MGVGYLSPIPNLQLPTPGTKVGRLVRRDRDAPSLACLLRVAAAAERGLVRPNQGGTAVHTVLEQIAQGRFLLVRNQESEFRSQKNNQHSAGNDDSE